jgi:hypothetical protein
MRGAADWRRLQLAQTWSARETLARRLGVAHPYAVAPFIKLATEAGPLLAAITAPPPAFDVEALLAWDARPAGDVLLIDRAGGVALAGDAGGWIIGPERADGTVRLWSDGRAYARAWAAARQARIDTIRAARVPGLRASDRPDACMPGYVLAGPIERVRCWSRLLAAERVIVVDDPALVPALRRALIRAAGVPKLEAAALPTARRAA